MCLTEFPEACVILLLHIPWHMCWFFLNKKFLNKHSIFCSAEENQIIPIPFMLCDYYVENQTTAFFLKRGKPKSKSLSKLICCAKEHYRWV